MLDIAKEITKIRKKLNLTQTQFAKLVGIEQPYLSKIESGKNIPTLETLSEIFSNLGYTMSVTIEKEETTVESNKLRLSLDTNVSISISGYCLLSYSSYKFQSDTRCHIYTLIKDKEFDFLLKYLEEKYPDNIETKKPKKAVLYVSDDTQICALELCTNANQYSGSNSRYIDFEARYFEDAARDISIDFLEDEEAMEEKELESENIVKEVEGAEEIVENKNDLVLKDYIRYLDRLYRDDCDNHYDPLELNAKLVGVHILYFVILGFSIEEVKRHYFERCASLK